MATPNDTEKDTGLHPECRSAAPGAQGLANAGARDHAVEAFELRVEEVALRNSWTSAAPGSQGEANTRARLNRRKW